LLCEVLEVSRSGYYAFQKRPVSERQARRQELVEQMQQVHQERHKDCYGSPRMHKELLAKGYEVCENTVAQLMKDHDIKATTKRKFRHTTDSNHPYPVAENLLNQEFEQDQPDQVWVSDITYIPTREGWLYLVCVLDLYSRRVVGWSMSERMTKELVLAALEMALLQRRPEADLMHHSDRGSQYASEAFQRLLRDENITCSMSRKGNCYDNAVMESFFASLKKELVHQADYQTRAEARHSLFEYIEVFYNQQRLHSALGYLSPAEYERQYKQVA
jgi:putative transposase